MSFGQRLRELRRELDLAQAELAERAGCSVNTVRKFEADERRPSRELAMRLAEALGVPQRDRADFLRLARGAQSPGRGSLPAPLTRLIGRDADVAAVRQQLLAPEVRLLTLVGPPGVGKTRLALQVASELQDAFRDGAVFVGLASVRDPALVTDAIVQALGLRGTASRSLDQLLVEQLRQRQLLLVIDNFEQVMSARTQLSTVLTGAARVKALVTSRGALRIYGEHLCSVPRLGRRASETLFLERARAIRAGYAASPAEQALVAEICESLEGLPLAIELAAARARAFSPRAMADALARRLDLLSAGPTDFTPRQRSMRGALDWSYELLDHAERGVFARMAIFDGGATLDAIVAVCGEGSTTRVTTREIVEGLADKSLLQANETTEPIRFSMFEVVREYANERLLEQAGADEVSRVKHVAAAHFADFAVRAELGLRGRDQVTWLARVEAEQPNLRAALEWSINNNAAELAGRLGAALSPFWRARGLYHEGRRWLSQILAFGDRLSRSDRAAVLNGAGVLALIQSDYVIAAQQLEEARSAFAALGDERGLGVATSNLGWLAHDSNDPSRAQALFEQSLHLRRAAGDLIGEASALNNLGMIALERRELNSARGLFTESCELSRRVGNVIGLVQSLGNLGWVLQELGDYALAANLFEESLALAQQLDSARDIAINLSNLGLMALYRGDYVGAGDLFTDSLAAFSDLGDRRGIAEALEGLAGVAGLEARPEDAARLFGLADALRESVGAPLLPTDRSRYEAMLAPAREQLDAERWQAAWTAGRHVNLEDALATLLGRA